ncbi:radical SAM protein [Tumebacillus algifaecis]|uniref:Radical SAM protein n=1 Tax=Tumebacillus algifaecis TaxID=1214604 RepID=A0A223D5L7_9BACL|nr:radical SAM protein [Tumebacillus algifaecis]ASS76753.1 radical SAM protein [Tumebacillus algifaecis]
MKLTITHKKPSRLLNPASGFLSGYSHTLNPYTGCSYACSYCYVRQMPVALFRGEEWGTWIDVKTEAATKLKKELQSAKKKGPVTIFMSSSTDPYQPLEAQEKVTRGLLETMVEEPPDFLFVQTRSPLVTRDLDLFAQLKDRIRISITVETDRDEIRRLFAPKAPPIRARLQALQTIADAGLPVQAAIAPVLPCSDNFARTLAGIVTRVCLDDYFMGDGSGGRRTERLGIQDLYREADLNDWYDRTAYLRVWQQLQQEFPPEQLFRSQLGFLPN